MVPSTLLGLLAVGLALAAIPVYQWVSLVPRLGIRTLYRVRELRVALATLAVTLALIAARRSRSGRRYLVAVLALTPLSGALHASRLLVPLDDPEHRTVEEAGVEDDAMVLGAVIDGRAHAWLVRTLVPHHVVHDEVGGRAVVAAWCAVCNSGVVYDGTVRGRTIHFDPEGVWRRNMIVRDRETGTLWQHATGEALIGPLEGDRLEVLGGQLMTWRAWRTEHPETTVTRDTTAEEWRGLLPKDLTVRALTDWGVPTVIPPPGLTADDDRLDPLTEVVGVELDGTGTTKAYPVETLERRGRIEDIVDGRRVVVSYEADGRRAEVTVDDRPVAFKRTRWLEWFEFNPETSVHAG